MAPSHPRTDPAFADLPLQRLAAAALQRATDFGAEHADFRLENIQRQNLDLRDANLVDASTSTDRGFAVRVIDQGTWGFAAGAVLSVDEVVRVTEAALLMARASRPMTTEPIAFADEPVYPDAVWSSAYGVDPFSVATADKVALLAEWSAALLRAPAVRHVQASVRQVREAKFYSDIHGTTTTQQRVRLHPQLEVYGLDETRGLLASMRTIAPPTGRGWEYLTGTGFDWDRELAGLAEHLAGKLVAPSVEPGRYDLVIDPSNLWLTIHESIGHATELDRALGYEANYAGTSFATPDRLGELKYGSGCMHITGDRTVEHGLATVGYDDDGVAGQQFDLVREGVLVGFQTDRRMAALRGDERSTGCAFADSPSHVPIQRMANVSLQPAATDTTTEDLIGGVEHGIYVVGDGSWSIDMQRYNFQFTGQRFLEIRDGRLAGPLRDVAYQATTTDFWGAMEAVGGPSTWQLQGAFNCGKAQPSQVAPVSHGCPSALFRGIRILNARAEAGRR
ncbi:MAG TPA: TldD/PmbA family protein [Nocardioidaceae bacterium]|nr:TldD/PmbA family protein [Nocardioidaceae bacterium]